jgi:hypothetical protein
LPAALGLGIKPRLNIVGAIPTKSRHLKEPWASALNSPAAKAADGDPQIGSHLFFVQKAVVRKGNGIHEGISCEEPLLSTSSISAGGFAHTSRWEAYVSPELLGVDCAGRQVRSRD